MMRIVRVTVEGTSDVGAFSGTFEFGPGVQVISGLNRLGKSIAFAAIVWCLGVEQIYGVQACDNAIFPDAPRNVVRLGALEGRVTHSFAEIEVLREDGQVLVLRRAIVGQKDRITFSDGDLKGDLVVGRSGAMGDATAGFQATFRKWAGLPEARLMSSRGADGPIYLENLAPLFLIEQLNGWADIQAQQVYRYGLQEIADAAFEYVLGMDATLEGRFQRQRNDATAVALKEEARVIATDYESLLKAEGWTGELGTSGKLRDLVERWAKLDLRAAVKKSFNFDDSAEVRRLTKRVEALRLKLTKGKIDTESTADVASASASVVDLKERRHDLQIQLATRKAQWREQEHLLRSVETRLKSARDLARLKKDGIGILPKAECPTCHQAVDPERLELTEQSAATIEIHVTQLEHQRRLLEGNVDRMRSEVVEAVARADRLETEFGQAEHALRMVNQTVGPARESMVKAHNDLLAAERELDRVQSTRRAIEALQERIKAWLDRASQSITDAPLAHAEASLKTAFLEELRALVVAMGCAGVTATDAPKITLDNHYIPTLDDRWLRSYGSASDRARLIVAYVLALASVGRHHLGFVVLDEPLQQNPDEHHKRLFLDFLLTKSAGILHQVIVFTSLSAGEVTRLREANVSVQTIEERFLKLKEPPREPAQVTDEQSPDAPAESDASTTKGDSGGA